jgi:hypothetical protein
LRVRKHQAKRKASNQSKTGSVQKLNDIKSDVTVSPSAQVVPVGAAAVTAPESVYVTRLVAPDRPAALATTSRWSAIGRAGVGLTIISTGAFIAYTSMRANSWFGHSLTPDPVAGEVYSHLSVAAEVIACLLPTGIRFYAQSGEWGTALRGWMLLAVALVVVFFAAGGFAVTNLSAGIEARADRSTADTMLAQRRLDTLAKSRMDECKRRGDRCRRLEVDEQAAIAELERLRVDVKTEADPQAVALGITSARLHAVQAGSMVALCLFSGLFISFGAGLLWGRRT